MGIGPAREHAPRLTLRPPQQQGPIVTYPEPGTYSVEAELLFAGADVDAHDHSVLQHVTVVAPAPTPSVGLVRGITRDAFRLVTDTIAALARLWLPRPA